MAQGKDGRLVRSTNTPSRPCVCIDVAVDGICCGGACQVSAWWRFVHVPTSGGLWVLLLFSAGRGRGDGWRPQADGAAAAAGRNEGRLRAGGGGGRRRGPTGGSSRSGEIMAAARPQAGCRRAFATTQGRGRRPPATRKAAGRPAADRENCGRRPTLTSTDARC